VTGLPSNNPAAVAVRGLERMTKRARMIPITHFIQYLMTERTSLHYLIELSFDRYPLNQGDSVYLHVLESVEKDHHCHVVDCVVNSESTQFTINAELEFNLKLFIEAAKLALEDAFALKFKPGFSASTLGTRSRKS
jgi:hypothetical protein